MSQLTSWEKQNESPERQIKEYTSDLKRVASALILAEESETAIAIKIALGGNNYLEYWVEDNQNVINCLLAERDSVQKLLDQVDATAAK